MVGLSVDQLLAVMPALSFELGTAWAPVLTAAMAEFGISTPLRAAAFLAEAAHESGQLLRLEEDLHYSARGLLATWPARFTPELAATLAMQPERIANHVYGGRGGNGPETSGDGWRYRGRGIFQLTFRGNYKDSGGRLGIPLEQEPDRAAQPAAAARVAGDYWRRNGLSVSADAGDLSTITRKINGGLLGLAQRQVYYHRARQVLGA